MGFQHNEMTEKCNIFQSFSLSIFFTFFIAFTAYLNHLRSDCLAQINYTRNSELNVENEQKMKRAHCAAKKISANEINCGQLKNSESPEGKRVAVLCQQQQSC